VMLARLLRKVTGRLTPAARLVVAKIDNLRSVKLEE
jgi:hypothetical protein